MTTTYRALTAGEHPTGLHWTAGEVRALTPAQAEGAPPWLTPAPTAEAPQEGAGATGVASSDEGGEGA